MPLPCCVDAPEAFVPKARYALETLLRPMGLTPGWVTPAELPEAGLYYGLRPEATAARVALPLLPDTAAFFERPAPYDARRVGWLAWEGERWPVLFGGAEPDLVASAFFWLSGWQELASAERDAHGRFPYEASLQARLGTAVRPAVDAYREVLAGRLAAAGLPLAWRTWRGHAWVFCPTHDIDYLRKWRPGIFYREVVEFFLLNRRKVGVGERVRRLGAALRDAARRGDPCRTAFDRMQAETAARGGTATYFLKTAAPDPHDVPYRLGSAFLRRRIPVLQAADFEIGLHPSYRAHTDAAMLAAERERLVRATGRDPLSVRQHYLRYEAPTTPRLQADLGFRIDSTLGFAGHEGFRHATCLPFQVFDADANAALDLWEMPLAVMESTLFNRRGLDAEGARAATDAVMRACRRFGGACVALWHNTLWDELDYPGWGRHFVETLDAACDDGALVASLRDALDAWG